MHLIVIEGTIGWRGAVYLIYMDWTGGYAGNLQGREGLEARNCGEIAKGEGVRALG